MMNDPNKPKRTSNEKAGLALAGSLGVESLGTARAIQHLRGKKLKPLPIIGDKGEVALQAANLGVGAFAARKLLQKPKDNGAVMKDGQSMISKADGYVSSSGHGKSLVEKKGTIAALSDYSEKNQRNRDEFLASRGGGRYNVIGSGLFGGAGGAIIGSNVGERAYTKGLSSKRNMAIGAGIGAASLGSLAGIQNAGARHRQAKRAGQVEKAYRRFDPEADRQRRAGLYTGLGVLGAGLAGREAANHFTTKAKDAQGLSVRGVVAKPKKGRIGLGLAAVAGASGAFGAHSYKSGLSTRNQPWT